MSHGPVDTRIRGTLHDFRHPSRRSRVKGRRWFRPAGLFYVPVSAPGWALTAAALVFCAWNFRAVDARSHSVSDTLIGVFPYAAPALLALYVIAMRTSDPPG
jgi:hypothetical protein